MKDLTPNTIALRISFLVALIVFFTVFIIEYFESEMNFVLLVAVLPFSFAASYISFRLAIQQFLYRKIKLIYRTIHRIKLDKGEADKKFDFNTDVLGEVKAEVEKWDKTNKQEIEKLRELKDYQREFVGNVSHELKTPIFNIQGYLLTLLEGALDDQEINERYLRKANKSVDRMISLVEDLDEITKLESGTIQMNMNKLDLVDLIKDVFASLEMKAERNGVSIGFAAEHVKPIYVTADSGRIRQVLVNLLVNSIKYGKEGGETLVKLFDMHDNILVEVSDNGSGIAEEHLPRLFERFYRTDKGRDRQSGGTGLGLAIVKHILEAHNQTVNVRSTVGIGSTFSFTLKKA
jgi:two-component system phosphate regulon sensor histidine kinase PhoR